MRSEFAGNIMMVREVEDCIRATKKYTKGVFSRSIQHPIQGGEFPSRVLTEYYEVYPDLDIETKMPIWDALTTFSDWVWGDIAHIDVLFKYNYPTNKAWVIIGGGTEIVKSLAKGIPGFSESLAKVIASGNGTNPKV